jgi:AcrR family transcriptional regulator
VLRSAIELAAKGPFRELTIEQIAKAAGISRSAFYTHFADKHELLLVAVGELEGELAAAAEGWWRGATPPAVRVRAAVEGLVSVYADHAELLRLIAEVSTYDGEVRARWLEITGRFIDGAADAIRAEQRAGLIAKAMPAQTTAEGLVWMTERCCQVYLSNPGRVAEDVVEALVPIWTAALYPGLIPADELRPTDIGEAAGEPG